MLGFNHIVWTMNQLTKGGGKTNKNGTQHNNMLLNNSRTRFAQL